MNNLLWKTTTITNFPVVYSGILGFQAQKGRWTQPCVMSQEIKKDFFSELFQRFTGLQRHLRLCPTVELTAWPWKAQFEESLSSPPSSQMAPWKRTPLPVQDTQVWSLDREDPLEEGIASHSSILAWRIPWPEEPGGLQSIVAKSQTRLKQLSMHASSQI